MLVIIASIFCLKQTKHFLFRRPHSYYKGVAGDASELQLGIEKNVYG